MSRLTDSALRTIAKNEHSIRMKPAQAAKLAKELLVAREIVEAAFEFSAEGHSTLCQARLDHFRTTAKCVCGKDDLDIALKSMDALGP